MTPQRPQIRYPGFCGDCRQEYYLDELTLDKKRDIMLCEKCTTKRRKK